jgi:hexokinase
MSKFGFQTIENALATVAHDMVVGARAVAASTASVQKIAPTIEEVTALLDPPVAVIERAAFQALGSLAKAANDASTTASDKGLNIALDEQTIDDYKRLYLTLTAQLKALILATSAGDSARPDAAIAAKTS